MFKSVARLGEGKQGLTFVPAILNEEAVPLSAEVVTVVRFLGCSLVEQEIGLCC